MAHAEKRTIPPVPVEPEFEVVLTLTEAEALTLAAITNNTAGMPYGPRGDTDRIGEALRAAGVDTWNAATERGVVFARTQRIEPA